MNQNKIIILAHLFTKVRIKMRRNKFNQHEQLIRFHKTPSPSSFTELKSPKLAKSTHKLHEQNSKINTPTNQKFNVFKSYLLQAKDRENDATHQNMEIKHKWSKQQIHENMKYTSGDNKKIDTNPYSLAQLSNSQSSSRLEEQKVKNIESDRQGSRKNSVSRDGSQSGHLRSNYQETIRKLANQNIRLRHQCKIMQQKYEKIAQDKKSHNGSQANLMTQIQGFNKKIQDLSQKLLELNSEVQNGKRFLSIKMQELKKSEYENYQMKQNIFDLKLIVDKYESRKRQKSSTHHQKSVNFISQRVLPPPNSNSSTFKPCRQCKTLTNAICELTNRLQHAKLQIGEKSALISTLCGEINKLQGELKLFEKPRLLHKRYQGIINDLNEDIIKQKAKELSYKYMKITK